MRVIPAIDEVMDGTDGLLFGRRTWEVMAGAWPGRAGFPSGGRARPLELVSVVRASTGVLICTYRAA